MRRLLVLLLLTSCTMHPTYERPEIATPSHWRVPTEVGENLNWWKGLGDPVLDEYIDEALANNQDIKKAIFRVEEYAAKLGIARSQLYPQIDLDAGAERLQESSTLLSNDLVEPRRFSAYNLVLNGSWEADIWGKIRSATQSALAEMVEQIEVRRTVVLTLVTQVANTYINLRRLDRQLSISKETLDTRNTSFKLADIRYKLGLTSDMQVQQARSEVEQAQIKLDTIKIDIATHEDLLGFLVGRSEPATKRGLLLDDFHMPPQVPAELPSELLNQRPDILSAEEKLKAANARIGIAKAKFFPDISLTGSLGFASSQLHKLLTNSSSLWDYGFSLMQEVFTGGRLTSGLRLARAEKQALLHNYESTVLNAFRDVNDSLVTHRITLDLIKTEAERVQTMKSYFHLANLRYNEGETDYLNFLDAERRLFAAELSYAQSQGEAYTTLVDIYKSLGGGWVSEVDEQAEYSNLAEKRARN
ncbi:MAG: efflux transporter outer membrane subunit [Simkaniaceae bacterium]|nr:efflux transporter outer membrane subunit [Simkaniaceae bacterium]